MIATAKAKGLRVSPRKLSLVAALVRGRSAAQAQAILASTNKSAAEIVTKVLDSAIANAENNLNLKRNGLVVESIWVDEGRTLKRVRPRSRGQANRINRRTSHLTIQLQGERATRSTGQAADEVKGEVLPESQADTKPVAKKRINPAEKK